MTVAADARQAFHQRLRALHLAEGYSYDEDKFQTRPYWPLQPVNDVRPHLWRWSDIRAAVVDSGRLVGLGHGNHSYDRRVIALTNPGLGGAYSLSGSLFGDIQLIRPGEGAPCHRHTPCAARFIFEGEGGWTCVEGEKTRMRPGDVIFTGQFTWHDHGNEGPDELLFLDVLDIPITQYLAVSQWEFDYERVTGSVENRHQPVRAENVSDVGNAVRFAPSWKRDPASLGVHRWSEVENTLDRLRGEAGSPHDGIRIEFTNIRTGGAVGPTMSIYTQLLRPREKTLSHRHTSSTIYVGVKGRGRTTIDGVEYDWGPRDIFVVPSWSWHSHESLGDEDAVVHSISDATLVAKMGLFREQRRLLDGTVEDSGWLDSAQ
jgi:gentisate 1,2-dioxygenase